MWVERYDRELANIFTLQNKIVQEVILPLLFESPRKTFVRPLQAAVQRMIGARSIEPREFGNYSWHRIHRKRTLPV